MWTSCEQVHLARFVQNQIACPQQFFSVFRTPISDKSSPHYIYTQTQSQLFTGPVSNPNHKAKPTLLNLGISTKLQPNYFNSNVTIFSNFGFMSSFLKKRLSHMVVNSL